MTSLATARLTEERKKWRKDHPFGFFARPVKKADGTLDNFVWECGIPGKEGTIWEGGLYKLEMKFPESYPSQAPHCSFKPPLFHPNVFPSGSVCLSILKGDWKPSMTVTQILLGIQDLLNEPNPMSPAHQQALDLFQRNKEAYNKKIKEIAKSFKPT